MRSLIGQFGVGFYSAFVVADRVTRGDPPRRRRRVRRRALGDRRAAASTRWSRSSCPTRGTAVMLHLKEDEDEFLEAWTLRSLVRAVLRPHRLPDPHAEGDRATATRDRPEWETVNHASALWTRPKSEISRRGLPGLLQARCARLQRRAGVDAQPRRGQPELHLAAVRAGAAAVRPDDGRARRAQGPQALHQARVHHGRRRAAAAATTCASCAAWSTPTTCRSTSAANCCSRTASSSSIKAGCAKRVLDLLEKLARDEPEKYATFCEAFGNVLKEGIVEDPPTASASPSCCASPPPGATARRRRCRWTTTSRRMNEGQDTIWYVTADGCTRRPRAARSSRR